MVGAIVAGGSNPGSVKLDHEKVPIEVQRLYDHEIGGTIGLKTYRKLHQMEPPENAVIDGIIKGLSMSDYPAAAGSDAWRKVLD
ncbi:MAG: hypothetical protein L6422_01115 [Candidatus Marinimicrobia bacterium]|nr:hypothetical protein [bacterium]MCG2714880.1 hypothetical protein [Candidatus Neomarinimicrobiota bacterium]